MPPSTPFAGRTSSEHVRSLAETSAAGRPCSIRTTLPSPWRWRRRSSRQLAAAIGLEVELRPLPGAAFINSLYVPGEPWDLVLILWAPDFVDPFQFINELFDPQFTLTGNVGRFDSATYNPLMRRAARLRGPERYRAYGELDVRLAGEAAPSAPISYFNEPTLVSKRVGCIVLRPALDLTAVCLK